MSAESQTQSDTVRVKMDEAMWETFVQNRKDVAKNQMIIMMIAIMSLMFNIYWTYQMNHDLRTCEAALRAKQTTPLTPLPLVPPLEYFPPHD
jgi:hypothetical protein